MAFRPYLFFGGNCREAFTRYQEIFGGELTLLTMKDVPGGDPPADQADMIIHAALTFGDDVLMASDDPTATAFGPVQGMMVSYDAADVADAKRVFDALADGGKVTQALAADVLLRGVRHVHRPVRDPVDDRRPTGAAAVLTAERTSARWTVSAAGRGPARTRAPSPRRASTESRARISSIASSPGPSLYWTFSSTT